MYGNPLMDLKKAGQSVWIDYLSRDMLRSGELGRLINEDGLCGVTSNPTIFQKAIEGSGLYDEELLSMIHDGKLDQRELFLGLAVEDIKAAADVLLPVYESTGGRDGYVSLEVSPTLANDTHATVEEALELYTMVGRKNLMIKVPATKAGIPAIERLTSLGLNVNVTLLFSVKRYEEAAHAYLRGLDDRSRMGLPLDRVNSVASFFVSRVDTLVDKMLDDMLKKTGSTEGAKSVKELRGKSAVANARLAYRSFREITSSTSCLALEEKGAHYQRLLWGSTGTKDPAYSDVKYVEELVGPDTVNTMPEDTIKAFRDHGKAEVTIDKDMDEAEEVFAGLASMGIDMENAAAWLEKDGVGKFTASYLDLLEKTAIKRDAFLKGKAA